MATSKERLQGQQVRLEQIDIGRYRSCRNTTLRPNLELSALIGVNGAGKTNILQAIRLLDARRGRVNRRIDEGLSRNAAASVTAWFLVGKKRIGLRIRFSLVEGPRRGDELAAVDEAWNFASITGSRAWRRVPPVALMREPTRARLTGNHFFLDEAAFLRLDGSEWQRQDFELLDNHEVMEAFAVVSEFRVGISYYSASQFTDPTRCPSSFEVDEAGRLAESYGSLGTSHLKFLHDLYRLKKHNPTVYEQYCLFVSRKQLGLVSRMTWKEIELSSSSAEVKSGGGVKKVRKRKTLVIPKVQIGSSYITFNQLSEGTFKTLALAFYVITDSSRLLMIEEPEVCVHHGLLSRIVGTIKAYSNQKQTIISTHSDLLVDELEPENIFVVEMTANGTRVKQLEEWLNKGGKAALHTYLAESGTLGEYWRSGGLS